MASGPQTDPRGEGEGPVRAQPEIPGDGSGTRDGRDELTAEVAGGRSRPSAWLWKELPLLLLAAVIVALLVRTFLIQAFFIPSASMEPTLMVGDRVLVNELAYRFHPPHRGDIIVFTDPRVSPASHAGPFEAALRWLGRGLGGTSGSGEDFIKRVIGLPGESVEVARGTVFIDGRPLRPEPYLSPIRDLGNFGPVRVPAGDLFVMGDDRANSNDSRGTLGFIAEHDVVGRAFAIVWPPSRWRLLSTPVYDPL